MSDYLTDEEQMDKLKAWWQENGLMLVAAVVVAVAGIVGWNWYGNEKAEQIARSSDLYQDYLAAEGTEQETIASTLNSEFQDSAYQTLILLKQAQARMSLEDAEGAQQKLVEALEQAPDEKLADLVRLRLTRVLQELDRTEEALATLKDVKSSGMRSQVQELKGDIHMVRDERGLANEAYRSALNEAGEGSQKPLLEMKVADTADANGA